MSQEKYYTPSQSPLHIWEEQPNRDKIGSQGGVFITTIELEEGNPQEPPIPSLEIPVAYFKGKELDLMVQKASHEFLSNDNFVKSRTF